MLQNQKVEKLFTFKEIMDASGVSHNAVCKRIKKLQIKPKTKEKNAFLYAYDDYLKIVNLKVLDTSIPTKFYAVVILDEGLWIVKTAGISKRKALNLCKEYRTYGWQVKIKACGKGR